MAFQRSLLVGVALLLAVLSVSTRAVNDTTPPTILIDLPQDGQSFTLHEPAVARWTVSDASELKRVEATVANGAALPTDRAGQRSLTVTAVDVADNRESRTHFYRVVYDAALTAPVTPASFEGEGRPRLSATIGDVIPFSVEVRDFFERPVAVGSWAVERARDHGCHWGQLSTDQRRDAKRFYERLGCVASHEGMKLRL